MMTVEIENPHVIRFLQILCNIPIVVAVKVLTLIGRDLKSDEFLQSFCFQFIHKVWIIDRWVRGQDQDRSRSGKHDHGFHDSTSFRKTVEFAPFRDDVRSPSFCSGDLRQAP